MNPGRLWRWAPWVACSVLLLTIGWLVATVTLLAGNAATVPTTGSGAELIWVLSWLGFGLVGALLGHRRPENPIGWTLLGIPFLTYLGLLLSGYAVRGLDLGAASAELCETGKVAMAPRSISLWLQAGGVAR